LSLEVKLIDQTFQLHRSGACYWVEQDVILLADVHLGKSAHFRKHGMAVPAQADDREFDKLNQIIAEFQPSRLWFLGDLFHSYKNAEWHFFEQWMRSQEIEIALVMGNHDVISRESFERLGMKTYDVLHMGDLFLTHHPEEIEGKYNIAGHIHPSVKLQGVGRQKLKLSCFFCTEYGMILPAFGDFTGTYSLKPKKGNRIFVIADDEVVELKRT
jgi:DNA ligase-associated metallophosphoesterase